MNTCRICGGPFVVADDVFTCQKCGAEHVWDEGFVLSSVWATATIRRLAAEVKVERLQRVALSRCELCVHYSDGCGSKNKDGICKHGHRAQFPVQRTRPATRNGVQPGLWSHVCRDDVCVEFQAADAAKGACDD